MPRIRYLKPEFFTDEDLAELSFQARLFYAGLWCHADKAGRLEDRPKYFKAVIFPYDNTKVEKILELLCRNKRNGTPFIQRYSVDGNRFLQILKWDDHQKPHNTEKESKIPPAPPLNKGNGEGNGEYPKSSLELNNREIPVKEPLINKDKEKQAHGEFNNVFLTENEKSKVSDLEIQKLSAYVESKGVKYKSHYATIISWRRKDEPQAQAPKARAKTFAYCPNCKQEVLKEWIENGKCPKCPTQ